MNFTFACGREADYPRNQMIIEALRRVARTHVIAPKRGSLTLSLAAVSSRLLTASTTGWSAVFAGFYGQPLVFPIRARWRGPLILDAFISTYDTYCFDRRLFAPHSLAGRLTFLLDQHACAAATIVITDTRAHARYFESTFSVPPEKLRVLYVGCDEQLFRPRPSPPSSPPTVLFYGNYLPLHGVETIVRAAHLLRDTPLRFRFVGRGQTFAASRALARRLGDDRMEFREPTAYKTLPDLIQDATICLGGPFGNTDKARRIIAGKTFQCLASGKPTIVGENIANRELLTHALNAYFCPMADAKALAQAIRNLMDSPTMRARLGEGARVLAETEFGMNATARAVRDIVSSALA